MKRRSTFNRILCALLAGLLIVELIAVFGITLLNKTILRKEYIIEELEKVNYYQTTKKEVEEAFEYYVLQSNLDDDCVKDLITVDKVKTDTLLLLDKYYEGSKEEPEIDTIREELTRRIHNKVVNEYNNIMTEQEEKDIKTLVNVIVENYSNNMSTIKECFGALYSVVDKLDFITEEHVKISYIATLVTVLLLSIVYIVGCKNKKIVLNKYHAIALMTVGSMILICLTILSIVVKEGQIQIFTKGITALIINIFKNIKTTVLLYGISTFTAGLLISLLKNILLRKYLK